jgi:hypothetical protein
MPKILAWICLEECQMNLKMPPSGESLLTTLGTCQLAFMVAPEQGDLEQIIPHHSGEREEKRKVSFMSCFDEVEG